jgi:hypothetical protein
MVHPLWRCSFIRPFKLIILIISFTASRTALGPTQPPIQWVSEALYLGVKWPGREVDHSPPSSAEVKNAWSYTSTPQYAFMAWCLVKHRGKFTFTLCLHFAYNQLWYIQLPLWGISFQPSSVFSTSGLVLSFVCTLPVVSVLVLLSSLLGTVPCRYQNSDFFLFPAYQLHDQMFIIQMQ